MLTNKPSATRPSEISKDLGKRPLIANVYEESVKSIGQNSTCPAATGAALLKETANKCMKGMAQVSDINVRSATLKNEKIFCPLVLQRSFMLLPPIS